MKRRRKRLVEKKEEAALGGGGGGKAKSKERLTVRSEAGMTYSAVFGQIGQELVCQTGRLAPRYRRRPLCETRFTIIWGRAAGTSPRPESKGGGQAWAVAWVSQKMVASAAMLVVRVVTRSPLLWSAWRY